LHLATASPEIIQYIKELQDSFQARLREYETKYQELKERYDLLIYKRFARSAEQVVDDKQQSLFAEEAGQGSLQNLKPRNRRYHPIPARKPGVSL